MKKIWKESDFISENINETLNSDETSTSAEETNNPEPKINNQKISIFWLSWNSWSKENFSVKSEITDDNKEVVEQNSDLNVSEINEKTSFEKINISWDNENNNWTIQDSEVESTKDNSSEEITEEIRTESIVSIFSQTDEKKEEDNNLVISWQKEKEKTIDEQISSSSTVKSFFSELSFEDEMLLTTSDEKISETENLRKNSSLFMYIKTIIDKIVSIWKWEDEIDENGNKITRKTKKKENKKLKLEIDQNTKKDYTREELDELEKKQNIKKPEELQEVQDTKGDTNLTETIPDSTGGIPDSIESSPKTNKVEVVQQIISSNDIVSEEIVSSTNLDTQNSSVKIEDNVVKNVDNSSSEVDLVTKNTWEVEIKDKKPIANSEDTSTKTNSSIFWKLFSWTNSSNTKKEDISNINLGNDIIFDFSWEIPHLKMWHKDYYLKFQKNWYEYIVPYFIYSMIYIWLQKWNTKFNYDELENIKNNFYKTTKILWFKNQKDYSLEKNTINFLFKKIQKLFEYSEIWFVLEFSEDYFEIKNK